MEENQKRKYQSNKPKLEHCSIKSTTTTTITTINTNISTTVISTPSPTHSHTHSNITPPHEVLRHSCVFRGRRRNPQNLDEPKEPKSGNKSTSPWLGDSSTNPRHNQINRLYTFSFTSISFVAPFSVNSLHFRSLTHPSYLYLFLSISVIPKFSL